MKIKIVIDGRTIEKLARTLLSRRGLHLLVVVALLVTGGTVFAISDTALYQFQPGTLISASRVNANFAALFAEVFEIEQSVIAGILKGEKGDKGETGDKGLKGLQGDKGDLGPRGTRGPQGDKGETGDKGLTGTNGADGLKPFLETTPCVPGDSACCNGAGGTKIEAGWDKNGDGLFTKPGDVTSTRFVCNGTDGKKGSDGTPWTALGPTGYTGYPSGPVVKDFTVRWDVQPSTVETPTPYTFCALIDVKLSDAAWCDITKSGNYYTLTGGFGSVTLFGRYYECTMRCYDFEARRKFPCESTS